MKIRQLGWFGITILGLCWGSLQASSEEIIRNIPYYEAEVEGSGDREYRSERCLLDIYVPDKQPEEKLPVLVWFHGGGLSAGGKHFPALLKKQGFLIVAVNYRLSPRAQCPDYLEDAAASIAWTFRNIAKYGGNPEKIYVSGHSAGGYLTAMVAMDPRYLAKWEIANTDLAGAFPISGQMATHFQIINERRGTKGGGPYNPIVVDEYAPLYHTNQKLPPMYLYVGDTKLEWKARVEENALLAAMMKLPAGHNVVEYYSFEGTNHGTVAEPAQKHLRKVIQENR